MSRQVLYILLIMTILNCVQGGMICYAICIASAGAAVLPYFGFGQGGVAPGGFAANLMALNGGEMEKNGFVPKSWKKHAKKFCENYCQSQ